MGELNCKSISSQQADVDFACRPILWQINAFNDFKDCTTNHNIGASPFDSGVVLQDKIFALTCRTGTGGD